jgi:hypothetical protein
MSLPSAQVMRVDGGTVILFVDDLHVDFRSTPRLRDLLIRRILPAVLGKGRSVGIVTTGYSSINAAPTTDEALLLARLRSITGGGLRPDDLLDERQGSERLGRARVALATAKDTITFLAASRTARPSIIYLSNGYGKPAVTAELDEIIAAAYRANVTIHALELHGLVSAPSPDLKASDWALWDEYRVNARDSLRRLAERAGGQLIWTRLDLDSALEQIASAHK